MRPSRAPSPLSLLVALGLLSGCFLAGYDPQARDEMDAGEAKPDAAPEPDVGDAAQPRDAGHEAGGKDAGVADARADSAARDAETRDAQTGDADTRDAGTPDAAVASDAAADAKVEVDASPADDGGTLHDGEAGLGLADAGPDAAVGADAGDASQVGIDASSLSDAGQADAGADACGPSGCVVTQTCTGSECDLVCSEPPDPGSEVTLDCKFDCPGGNRCASTCSSGNTCQTNCTSTNVCRASCPYNAACINNCTSVPDCGGTCYTGSNCVFNCTASTCTQVTCALGASCRIKCSGGGACDFAYCGNLIVSSCSDGSIVCGRLCP